MSISIPEAADYYLRDAPYHLQQGDILQGVPLITSPASPELVLLREPSTRRYQYPLSERPLEPVREKLVGDAFDEGRTEFIAVAAQRVPAVLMTPTCDLEKRDVWLFSPLKEVPDEVSKEIFSGKAVSLFPVYEIPEAGLPGSVIDVGDLRPVHRVAVAPDLRLKSMSPEATSALAEMIVRSQSRVWGYAAGELVPEDGVYRCLRDNSYYELKAPAQQLELKKGDKFPDCTNCKWSHKTAQWYRLTKLKKRS